MLRAPQPHSGISFEFRYLERSRACAPLKRRAASRICARGPSSSDEPSSVLACLPAAIDNAARRFVQLLAVVRTSFVTLCSGREEFAALAAISANERWSGSSMWRSLTVSVLLLVASGRDVGSRIYIESSTDDWKAVPSFTTKANLDSLEPACRISLHRDLTIVQPLLLEPGSVEFVWPRLNSTMIALDYGQPVELYCSHGFRKGSPVGSSKSVTVTCEGDDELGYRSERHNISTFACQRPVFHVAERTAGHCFGNGTIVRVGFDLGEGRFAQLYEACFDETLLASHYVKHRLTAHNDHHQRAVKRPSFLQGAFYGDLKMGPLYSFTAQHATLERLLGSRARADALLDSKKGMFFARGHLAAKSDFVFGSHQRASFWLMNVAPQWQRFNGLNWQRIETGVKSYVADRHLQLTVYTGTYGVLELPDGNGDPREIFLDFEPTRDPPGRVPVPRLFYKVLIDEEHQAGLALVGVNNPHATPEEIAEQYVICEDISGKIDWLRWRRHSIADGYSYACDVNDFNDVTGHLVLDKPIVNLLL
uniref:DNA/RNA non-specific endonuclease/pyrophosphatase/phosphodiesterase domain-containing protein n=1 Tax=Anopheles atroparvus TaxID=41427 RepID=A0A182IRT0_ANOAO